MSDEPQKTPPLSLRLKPRAVPPPTTDVPASSPVSAVPPLPAPTPPPVESAPPPPVSVPPPEPPAPAASADLMKFRLKPKTPPAEPPPSETPLPFSNPPLPIAAAVSPQVPAATPASVVPQAAPPPVPPERPMAPPAPLVPDKPLPPFRPLPPKHLQSPEGISDLPPVSSPPPSSLPVSAPPETPVKADKWLLAGVLLIVVIVGGTFGVRMLLKSNPKPSSTAKAPESAPALAPAKAPAVAKSQAPAVAATPKPATPAPATQPVAKPLPGGHAKLVEKPQSSAGKAIARARDTVAAVEQQELTQGVSAVLAQDAAAASPPKSAAAAPASVPATPPEPKKLVLGPDTVLAPVVEEVPAGDAEPSAPPSGAFRQFVVNLKVNGVFQGDNPRAMLNGRMFTVGQDVDKTLAIKLHRIEPESKLLIFRDDTGATLSRRY